MGQLDRWFSWVGEEEVLEGDMNLGGFMWVVVKAMDCLDEVSKRERVLEGNSRRPRTEFWGYGT